MAAGWDRQDVLDYMAAITEHLAHPNKVGGWGGGLALTLGRVVASHLAHPNKVGARALTVHGLVPI